MATLAAIATGNWLTAGTWGLCDGTAELDSEAANTALTTAYVTSSTFTPGAITIDGIAVKISNRATGSPTNTISVALDLATVTVAGTEVTIDVADLDAINVTDNQGGWYMFKFASPVTLLAATAYGVKAKLSATTTAVNLYRDATAGNWSRQLRTTTTQAPVAGDKLLVIGDHTGSGTGNSYTVTMNETATTDYGTSSTTLASIAIGKRGTLSYGVAASTAYYLKVSGLVIVYSGGTFNMGTVASPMPATSSGVLEFDSATNVDFGLVVRAGSTFVGQGNAITNVKAFLAADAAAAATSLTTDISTGWKDGDEIALAPTTRTATESEKKSLTADAVTTTLTIAALTNAHSGTSPIAGELANLTRNVKIRGVSATLNGYVFFANTASVDCDYVEFYQLGSATANKRGIDIATTTGSCVLTKCSIHDFQATTTNLGIFVSGALSNNYTIDTCVFYLTASNAIVNTVTTGTAWTITGNLVIRVSTAGNDGIILNDNGGTFTNNTVAGAAGDGITMGQGATTPGTFSGNIAHSNGGFGFTLNAGGSGGLTQGTYSTLTAWRNTSGGITGSQPFEAAILDTVTVFGNAVAGIVLDTGMGRLTIKSLTANGGVTLVQPVGIRLAFGVGGTVGRLQVQDSTMGVTTAHTTGDIDLVAASASYRVWIMAFFHNVTFGSSTEVSNQDDMSLDAMIGSQKHDQTAGNHKAWFKNGTITLDTAISRTASPSERLTPTSATGKLLSGIKRVAVTSGATITPSVYVRESVVGDGTDYNGNRIRLIVKANVAAGITADTVLATATASSEGAFELLTGTTAAVTDDAVLEFVVDCDGTTGWINVDDWTQTGGQDAGAQKYWMDGLPGDMIGIGGGAAGGLLTHPGMTGGLRG